MLKQKDISEKMSKDIDEMERMLNDYLQFAKTQAQENTNKINLHNLIDSIKENLNNGYRIITSDETTDKTLKNLVIFNFNNDGELTRKIHSRSADISNNNWVLNEVIIHSVKNGLVLDTKMKTQQLFFHERRSKTSQNK